jgi:hypothetical protein
MLTRMGYYNYQNGLILHHVKQKGGWAGHQEHCRNFIIRALDLYKPEKVTVLGSGWLIELPFAELVERTGKVRLVDIIHPPDVISQVAAYKNVDLIEQDITGGLIADVWQKTKKYSFLNRIKSLEKIVIPEFQQDDDPGMVISINILTQLESLLLNFIKKRSKIREEEFTRFKSEIQRKHIDFLRKNNAVLITDYAEVFTDRSGNIRTVPTLLTDLPPYRLREEWTWNFDLTGAELYNSRSQFKIVALIS